MLSRYLILSVVLIAVAKCQSTETSLADALSSLPPELQGKVDEAQIKSLQNTSEVLFKEKCDKNGGPDAYSEAQTSLKSFKTCVSNLVNPASLAQEIEDAKPEGKVDEVFKSYCAKTPQFKECFQTTAEKVKTCLAAEEKNNLKTVYNITDQLADFICYKDGDRIALFIAEGGPECIQDKQEQLQNCMNTTIGNSYQVNTNNITANVIPKIVFGEKECGKIDELQVCVVKALESCAAPTTANIVESLFKFVKQATPCDKFQHALAKNNPKPKSQTASAPVKKANSASGLFVTVATVLMGVAMTVLA